MSEIKDGTYIIRNLANLTLGVDSKGATDGNGANVQFWTVNKLNDGTHVNIQTCSDGTVLTRTITADGTTDIFILDKYTSEITDVLLNDTILEKDTDYTIELDETDNLYKVTFTTTPEANDQIDIRYLKCWRLLVFPATGKAISVGVPSNGIPASGCKVYQWDIRGNGKGGGEQMWSIDSTGSTATFSGETYNVYKIFMYLTKSGSPYTPMLMEFRGTGTPRSGDDICVSGDEVTSQDQMWIFEPSDPVFPGTYRIVPRTNASYCCYVNGASKSAGARIGVQPWTGDQNQIWYVQEAPNGRVLMRPVHSFGDFATFATNTATRGDQCCQDNHGATATDHQWSPFPQDNKTVVIDGTSHQCYELSIYAAIGGLVLDIPSANVKNWLQIYTPNGSDAQMWAFVPEEVYDRSLPVPTSIGVSINGREHLNGNIEWDSEKPIFPIWDCSGTKFQARYRTRIIGVSDSGTEVYPDGWTNWKSMADGTESNNGWGTSWLPNQIFDSPADHKIGKVELTDTFVGDGSVTEYVLRSFATAAEDIKVNVDGTELASGYIYDDTQKKIVFDTAPANGSNITVIYISGMDIPELTLTNPACDIEIEVRYFTNEWSEFNLPAHGPSASGTVRVYKPMTVTVTGVERNGEGIAVSFESDWATGATTAKISSMETQNAMMIDPVTESGKYAASDTVTIPWGDIDQHVAIGDSISLTLDLSTALGVAGTISYTGTVQDAGDVGVTPTYSESDHASYTVIVPHDPGETVQMFFLQKGIKPIEMFPFSKGSTEDRFDLLVPLNTEGEYEVVVSGFAVAPLTLPAITSHFAVWTFGDGDWAVLDWGLNQNPTQEDGQNLDVDEYQLTGRDFHAYRQRASMSRDLTITGAFVESMPEHGSRKALMRLLKQGHAVYRNFRGEIHNVFVSGISIPLKDTRFTEVTVTQNVETR